MNGNVVFSYKKYLKCFFFHYVIHTTSLLAYKLLFIDEKSIKNTLKYPQSDYPQENVNQMKYIYT